MAVGDRPPRCPPGERILASGSVQLPRFTLLESGSLLISPAHLTDAGTYTCLATNSRGVDEASADLVVWGKVPALQVRPCWVQCQGLERGCSAWRDAKTCTHVAACDTVPSPISWVDLHLCQHPAAPQAVPFPHPFPPQHGHASPTHRRTRVSSRAPRPP